MMRTRHTCIMSVSSQWSHIGPWEESLVIGDKWVRQEALPRNQISQVLKGTCATSFMCRSKKKKKSNTRDQKVAGYEGLGAGEANGDTPVWWTGSRTPIHSMVTTVDRVTYTRDLPREHLKCYKVMGTLNEPVCKKLNTINGSPETDSQCPQYCDIALMRGRVEAGDTQWWNRC